MTLGQQKLVILSANAGPIETKKLLNSLAMVWLSFYSLVINC